MTELLKVAIEASLQAGRAIMEVYQKDDFQVEPKNDDSPLTLADKKANEIIIKHLAPLNIPVISEESREIEFRERSGWAKCWIVDPLDGTKEFIKRNDEFTVNIALVEGGKPKLGVIFAPALNILYFGLVTELKSYRCSLEEDFSAKDILTSAKEIFPDNPKGGECLKVVGSRSHMNEDTLEYIEELKETYGDNVKIISKGSSLKFCLVAEGKAHIYPRFAPTMEWDTAAGHAICEAVGLKCVSRKTGNPVTYNRENLLNDHFSVSHAG